MKRVLLMAAALVCSLTMFAQSEVAYSPQTDALYRLPFEKGVGCVAHKLTPVRMNLARHYNMVDFCAWELVPAEPTKIVAPRDGVVECIDERGVLLRHEENVYSRLRGFDGVTVSVGDKVAKGDVIANPIERASVWMEVFYQTPNPDYGKTALSGNSEFLTHYVNPVFATRGKCKVQLTDGNPYTVKARTWCWPWE